jgi:hypothetical protein
MLVGLEGIHDVEKASDHHNAKQRVPQILQHSLLPPDANTG